ncbi:MAG: hypothetical protein SPI63_00425 [Bulleidia sp.]|nr:hypothetical protein [Bulleidia sp.]
MKNNISFFRKPFVTQLYNELAAASRQYPDQRLPIPWDIIWDEFGISPALKDPNTVFAASHFRRMAYRCSGILSD